MHDRLMMSPVPKDPHGLVIMLHGGAEFGEHPVDGRSLALRRTRAMLARIGPDLHAAGIAAGVLRFTVKGWNADKGQEPSPVQDARLALADVAEDFAGVPVVLLGHSMGARTAVHVADDPGVVGVVGLAPWFPADEPVDALAGKHLVAAHGARDRITSPKASRTFVERAGRVAASARWIDMGPRGHYMLTRAAGWNEVALKESLGILERVSPHC